MNRIKYFFESLRRIAIILALIGFSLTGCEKYVFESTKANPDTPYSFDPDIVKIFNDYKCSSCHPSKSKPELTYDILKKGGYFSIIDPASSKLYLKLIKDTGHQGFNTTENEENIILYWITQGAKESN
jgi:hypothetical protein